MSRHQQRGMTLIELLIALAIFAVLGTLTYQATSHVMLTREQVEQQLTRWRQINRGMQIIENEVLQIVAPPIPYQARRLPALHYPDPQHNNALSLLNLANPDVVERNFFIYRQNRIEWLHHPDLLPSAKEQADTILEQVEAVHWSFLTEEGWSNHWPPNSDQPTALPNAIALELSLSDIGRVRRVYALR